MRSWCSSRIGDAEVRLVCTFPFFGSCAVVSRSEGVVVAIRSQERIALAGCKRLHVFSSSVPVHISFRSREYESVSKYSSGFFCSIPQDHLPANPKPNSIGLCFLSLIQSTTSKTCRCPTNPHHYNQAQKWPELRKGA